MAELLLSQALCESKTPEVRLRETLAVEGGGSDLPEPPHHPQHPAAICITNSVPVSPPSA